eukprot:gene4175-6807_t
MDNKAAVPVGVPAVNRHIRLNKLFCMGDEPEVENHQFVIAGKYTMTPSGYLLLQWPDDIAPFQDDDDRE